MVLGHWANLPPSTAMEAPVMNGALSEARNTIVRAISSGRPARLTGTPETNAALLSSVPVNRASIPVSIGPGATTLTRTPDSAHDRCPEPFRQAPEFFVEYRAQVVPVPILYRGQVGLARGVAPLVEPASRRRGPGVERDARGHANCSSNGPSPSPANVPTL
jgi:hypothetical protein